MCAFVVHDAVSLWVHFTSSFKVGKELFIVNFHRWKAPQVAEPVL